MKSLIKLLSEKFMFVEVMTNNKFMFRTFYKNGSIKNWYTIEQLNENEFRFTKGGVQKCDGDLDKILFILSGIS
jgi:hypothetical protein